MQHGDSRSTGWRKTRIIMALASLWALVGQTAAQAAAPNTASSNGARPINSGPKNSGPNKTAIARLELGEPPGFAALTAEQSAVVDIYFGGKRIGDAKVSFRPGSLTFADPAKLVALLPDLVDAPAVLAALSASGLPGNPGLVCTPGANPAECGRLSPRVAGVIFDQDRFRIDLFVNPQLMAIKQAVGRQYVQRPEPGLSMVDSIGAVMSGSSGGQLFYNVQNNLIIGDADRRLRAEFAYASGFGFQADRMVLELDKPERRYMAGAFWAQGTDLIGRRKILGLGIETQLDTRLDKDALWGNPLVVFLAQRARVDIVRDGRVLTSRIYDAGNQSLDTRALPNGSYEVTLQIVEAGGGLREEKRFFTKNQSIAAPGQKIFFAYAGVLADDTRRAFVAPTGTPFLEAGLARRISPRLALDATVAATNKTVMGEIGAYVISPLAQVRLAAVASTRGQYGGLLQVSSQGNARLGFNFDLRRIGVGKQQAAAGPDEFAAGTLTGPVDAALPLARRTFTQVSGSLSYSLKDARLGFAASYRREQGQPVNYSFGPSFRWEFLRRGQLRMSASGDLAFTSQGRSGFVGLSLQLIGNRSSVSADAGMRSAKSKGEPGRSGAVGSLRGTWQDDDFAGAELNLAGGYDRDLEQDALNASAELRGNKLSLQGDVTHSLGNSGSPTQYSLGLQTTLGMRGGRVVLRGRDQNDSMVIVKVDGAGPDDRFDVLVNDGKVGSLRGGGNAAVAVPAYRQYEVRVRQTGGDLLHYDGSVRKVGLYPGNVAQLSWKARKVIAMFGRLMLPTGEPVRQALVSNPAGIGETDDNGYFQIEAESGSALEVGMRGGAKCRVDLPQLQPQDGYAPLGTLICLPPAAPFRLSSATK